MNTRTTSTKRPQKIATDALFSRIQVEDSFKAKAYAALKEAILKMDLYGKPEPIMLDERELSDRLGVSRTPVREAVAMLEQDGFLRTVPRRGILVVKKNKREIIEMVQAWAALEGMAARLITVVATQADIQSLRPMFAEFSETHRPREHLNDYSSANIAFHQAIIRMSGCALMSQITNTLFIHMRAVRAVTMGWDDRAQRSMRDHLAIIGALERRDPDAAERLAREHTLSLAAHIEAHGDQIDGGPG